MRYPVLAWCLQTPLSSMGEFQPATCSQLRLERDQRRLCQAMRIVELQRQQQRRQQQALASAGEKRSRTGAGVPLPQPQPADIALAEAATTAAAVLARADPASRAIRAIESGVYTGCLALLCCQPKRAIIKATTPQKSRPARIQCTGCWCIAGIATRTSETHKHNKIIVRRTPVRVAPTMYYTRDTRTNHTHSHI